ncbi:MAG: ABC transporter permease [Gemmatimonadaceae bacterium]|nr:ABC transporter permease [Gemmatimonadaceae bacterium]
MTLLSRIRLTQLVRKELLQLLRDPRSRRLLIVAPIIQLLVFGYAVNTDVRHARTFLLDADQTAESRALASALTASGHFVVTQTSDRPAAMARALDAGDVLLGVHIPRGFAADVAAGRPTAVQLLVDGSSANTANVALGYATQILGRYGRGRGAEIAARSGVRASTGGVEMAVRVWYNPNLESRTYNVPAVMGNIVMLMALLLTSLAVVRERELGTLEQLMVSPLSPAELMIGKTVPSALVAMFDVVLVTAVSLLWFRIPFAGSFVLLGVASLLFVLTGLGVGLLISTISKTQQEAFMSMFMFFLPALMLGGLLFPVDNMPHWVQLLSYLDPIRHFLIVVRGIFLRGAGWGIVWPELLWLAALGAALLWLATKQFHKTAA